VTRRRLLQGIVAGSAVAATAEAAPQLFLDWAAWQFSRQQRERA
jgi:hypothetical protein